MKYLKVLIIPILVVAYFSVKITYATQYRNIRLDLKVLYQKLELNKVTFAPDTEIKPFNPLSENKVLIQKSVPDSIEIKNLKYQIIELESELKKMELGITRFFIYKDEKL